VNKTDHKKPQKPTAPTPKPTPIIADTEVNLVLGLIAGFITGVLLLCVVIFVHQSIIGENPFTWRIYILPAICGGLSGIIVSNFFLKRQVVLSETVTFERKQRLLFQRDLSKANILLKQLQDKLRNEIAANVKASAALRKSKQEMTQLTEITASLGNVFIVDNEPGYLAFLQDAFKNAEFTLYCATTGREALMKMMQIPADLVISDYRLPEMTAADFLKNVKFDYPAATRAVMGDYEYQPSVVQILTEGLASSVFMKPKNNDITDLQNGIARVLKLRKVLNDGKISALMGTIEQMPKLPLIFNEFSDAVRREANFQQLADIISKDTAVAAKLLQISNSAFFSSEKTASLEQAIMMLGVSATRDIVLTASLSERGAPRTLHMEYFQKIMKHSLVVNKYMEPFSRLVYGKSIDRNFKSVGLTHDIGKIILLQNFPDRFDKIVSMQLRNPKASFYDCEIALGYGDCTHAEIGAYLLDLWNFPTISVEVALYHHTPTLARDTQYNEILRIASMTNEVVNYLSSSSNLENINLNDFLKAIKNELM